jgi:NADP-reducing hydrogenase subunit HndB
MSAKITSAEELKKLRDRAQAQVSLRSGPKEVQVVVHMGTCGIAAGARDVMSEMAAGLDSAGLDDVTLRQSGCIGLCDEEPMMTVTDRERRNFLYVDLTREKVRRIVKEHLAGGKPVEAFLARGEAEPRRGGEKA